MNGSAFLSIHYRLPLEHSLKKQHIEIDNFWTKWSKSLFLLMFMKAYSINQT